MFILSIVSLQTLYIPAIDNKIHNFNTNTSSQTTYAYFVDSTQKKSILVQNEVDANSPIDIENAVDTTEVIPSANSIIEQTPEQDANTEIAQDNEAIENAQEELIVDDAPRSVEDVPQKRKYNADAILSLQQANRLYEQYDYTQAIEYYTKALDIEPDWALVHNNRSLAYYYLKNYTAALQDSNAAINIDSSYISAYRNRAFINMMIHNVQSVIKDLNIVLAAQPEDILAYSMRGAHYIKVDQLDEALVDFQTILGMDNENIEAHNNIGTIYYHNKEYAQAYDEYTTVIDIALENGLIAQAGNAYFNRGNTQFSTGELDNALSDFMESSTLLPTDFANFYNMGVLYSMQDKRSDAYAAYGKAIVLQPTFFDAYYNRALLFLEDKDYQSALMDLDIVIKNEPKIDAYLARGIVYKQLQQYNAAVNDYQQALQIDPKSESALFNISIVEFENGNFAQAESSIKKFIALNKDTIPAYVLSGYISSKLHKYGASLEAFDTALDLSDQDPQLYFNRALIYQGIGNIDAFTKDLASACDIDVIYCDDTETIFANLMLQIDSGVQSTDVLKTN